MTVFRSKVGPELVIPLSILLGGLAFMFLSQKIWAGAALIAAVGIFTAHTFLSTRYTVNGTSLRIQCGLFFDETIDIRTIISVRGIRNAMSAPAASLDRMELRYNQMNCVLISPKDKQKFLNALKQVNPSIIFPSQDNQ